MPEVQIPRGQSVALVRLCTPTTSRISIEWTRAGSRSRLNLRGPHERVQDVALLAAALTDPGDHDVVHEGREDLVEAIPLPGPAPRAMIPRRNEKEMLARAPGPSPTDGGRER